MKPRVRACVACRRLLIAGADCEACEAREVHVVTTLGQMPPPWPGRRVRPIALGRLPHEPIRHHDHPGRVHEARVRGMRPDFTTYDEGPASPNAGPWPGVEWSTR